MALVDGNGGLSAADIAAVTGNNNGFGFGNDGAWWLIILLLFANGGNWGNGFNGGGAEMQRGFDQQAVMSGLGNLANGLASAEVSATNRQMANMQQLFNTQTAIDGRLDAILANIQNCCCENRAQTADLKYTMANESASTRAANQANTQVIMDKLCQLEMDGIKQNYENRISGMQNQIDALRQQLNAVNNAASQNAQTAAILADNSTQTVALEQYLNPTPVPAYPVQNPNCCRGNGFGFNA